MPDRIELGQDMVSASVAGLSTLSSAGVATANPKGSWQPFYAEELMTLSTSGATTTSVQKLFPANAIILGVGVYVVTTITTAANWKIGDGTTDNRFHAVSTNLTAGLSSVGLSTMLGVVSTTAAGPTQATAANAVITCNATPGAGALRVCVFGYVFTPPSG